ncbi:hypothetical protein C8R44DRAFT_755358 [Mycena epipterygia]|nr:hypothetical protein C8R44DRAFT_755358 [Mycena epipterygia]
MKTALTGGQKLSCARLRNSLWYFTQLILVALHQLRGGNGKSVGGSSLRGRVGVELGIAHHGLKGESGRKEESTSGMEWDDDEDECGMHSRTGGGGVHALMRVVGWFKRMDREMRGWRPALEVEYISKEGSDVAAEQDMLEDMQVPREGDSQVWDKCAGRGEGMADGHGHGAPPHAPLTNMQKTDGSVLSLRPEGAVMMLAAGSHGQITCLAYSSKQRVRTSHAINNSATPPGLAEHPQQAVMANLACYFQTSSLVGNRYPASLVFALSLGFPTGLVSS